VAFHSEAFNFVADDTNGFPDIFVNELTWLDSTPPTINVPADIMVNATSPAGATVMKDDGYTVTATDDVDWHPTVSCDPKSGSIFLIGITTVKCTATGASGNKANKSFNVVWCFL
jgi:hypothetical protein